MSLKNVQISRIFKKRKAKDLFLAEESLVSKSNQNQDTLESVAELKKYRYQPLKFLAEEALVSKSKQNQETLEPVAELKEYRYQPLKFAKDDSTKCSSSYKIEENFKQQKEVTVIPETDIEGKRIRHKVDQSL